MTAQDKLTLLALDLSVAYPRSPRYLLGDYVVAARTLDKCRALLNSTNGEYKYDCPLDNYLFDFIEITAAFQNTAASGATDDEFAAWLQDNAKARPRIEIIQWNNRMRDTRISDLPNNLQEFLEDYIPLHVPQNRPVYRWFDVYDLEEQRI
jgi:hypothetical protein